MKGKYFQWNGLKFDVSDTDVYPPKPASLLLAKNAIKVVKHGNIVLDACTGCGVVATAVEKFIPESKVFASDINPAALAVAKKNFRLNKVKIGLILSDLYKEFENNKFDVIIVHPPAVPYFNKMSWKMPKGMKIATYGGRDGSLLVIKSIIGAKRCLKKDGILLLLLPHWCNTKKVLNVLKNNYRKVSELANKKVKFFPAIDYDVDPKSLDYIDKLSKNGVIEISFKNNKPYSTVSVIQAIK